MPWMFFPTLLHKGSKIKWQLCAGALREAVFAQIGWLFALVIELQMTWMPGINPLASTAIRISEHSVGKEPIPSMNADTESIDKGQINVVARKDGALVYLKGRIDIDFSPVLRNRLLVLMQAPRPKTVCIDLSAVTHIDSSGIATLIEALKIARGQNTELRLLGLHDRLLGLFESTGILSLFNGNARRPSQRGCAGV